MIHSELEAEPCSPASPYRKLFELSCALLCVTDRDGRIMRLNPAAERIFGLSNAQLLGTSFVDLLDPVDRNKARAAHEDLLAGRSVSGVVLRYRVADGGLRWLDWYASPGPEGRIYASAHDITEMYVDAEQTNLAIERFDLAMQGASDGFWDWPDVSRPEQWWSPRLWELLGYEAGSIPSTIDTISQLIHPEDESALDSALSEHFRRGAPFDLEYRLKTASQGYRYFRGRGIAVRDERGRAVRMAGSVADITDRREAERERDRLASVAAHTSHGVILADSDGVVEWVNDGFQDIFGWRSDQIRGMSLAQLIAGSDADPDTVASLQQSIAAGRRLAASTRGLRPSGDGYSVDLEVRPTLDASGRTTGIVVIAADVTARRDTEDRLQRYADQADAARRRLEEQAEQLRVQAAELAAAREEALESARLKSVFLATMSHEIRTPMNGVIGMTNILEETELTAEQREYLATIRGSADSLLTLINDILDFSKIEAGKLAFESIELDLRACVEDCAELLSERAAAKGVDLSVWIDPDVPRKVVGDPGRLRQVVLNLLSNAVRFTDEGFVSVRVERMESSESAAALKFSVEDSGIGITPEASSRLFAAFSQADESTTRKYGGTGLGLAISKQLAEGMGGEIGLHSEPGAGSTFWFTARLGTVDEPPADDARVLAGSRFYVVAGPARSRDLLVRRLEGWGAAAEVFDAPQDALARLEASGASPAGLLIGSGVEAADSERLAQALRRACPEADLFQLAPPFRRPLIDHAARVGATVVFEPLREARLLAALTRTERQVPEPSAPAVEAASPGDASPILVAEDNPVNRLVVLKMLERLGREAVAVENGQEAVEAVAKNDYSLILMDCQMPVMDGFEASRKIREFFGRRPDRPPIVALTANAMQGDEQTCLDAGMDGYLSKPIQLAELGAALEKWSGADCLVQQ